MRYPKDHWIGLLGKILTANPWVFTIKYSFPVNFPIIQFYEKRVCHGKSYDFIGHLGLVPGLRTLKIPATHPSHPSCSLQKASTGPPRKRPRIHRLSC